MMYYLLYIAGKAVAAYAGNPEAAARACHAAIDVVHEAYGYGLAAHCVFTMGA